MHLKSIEVQGFKSFSSKIKFDFHEGITGIVGPNGSGKSNVADAVRWVLGEQRVKQLRGGNMQDVIFAGTESRKPLSYASVAITLDNSDGILPIDYKEVTVTRKLYRSGESDYLLNGVSCRLKTINELFYDTGIGKEGYSIIGQGQIDKILSGKPEDRRELFDEAAGIVKFKRRKNQSLKKLEDERFNLLRVKDIINELEKQLQPLEEQSQVAKEYLKKKKELKTYDINMFLLETARLKGVISDIEKNIENTSAEMEETEGKYKDMKAEYEAVEDELESNELSIDTAKNQLNETKLLKQQLEGRIQVLNEQIKTAKLNDEHYSNRQNAIKEDIESKSIQKQNLEKEFEEAFNRLNQASKQEKQLERELIEIQTKIAEVAKIIDNNKSDIYTLLNNRATTKASIQHYDTSKTQLENRREELKGQLREIGSSIDDNKKDISNLEEKLKQTTLEMSDLEITIEQNEKQLGHLQGEINQLQESLRANESSYLRQSSKLESLRNITERYEGYGNSVRKVMDTRKDNKGLLGVVADIIKVDKAYEVAMETALGGSIQNVVTDNEDTAKKAINYLKQNKLGRATFLPLSSMKASSSFSQQDALKEDGVIGLADTLVNFEEKYQGVARQLLGRTIVVNTIESAVKIAKKYNQSLRIVTLEGELINPGGSISGGAYRNSSNLLSRRREIEELEQDIVALEKETKKINRDIDKLKETHSKSLVEAESLKEKNASLFVEKNTISINLEQAMKNLGDTEEQRKSLGNELATLEKEFSDIVDNEESLLLELETSEALEEKLSIEIQELEKTLVDDRNIEAEQLKRVEAVHLETASLDQQKIHIRENIDRIDEEFEKLDTELRELTINKGQSYDEIQEKELEITNLGEAIVNSDDLTVEIEEEIRKQTALKETLTKKYKSFLDNREELSRQLAELDKELFRLTSRKKTYEENVDKQINYMWEEYEMTYNHSLELRNESLTDISFMKRQIQTIKGEIKELGDVNVNAIEEYKNVSERYVFLSGQHDDLEEAERTLVQIIEELDTAMRKQFKEQFGLIGKEFDKVFKALFGGGIATLDLMEDADILDAGIRIIAQPPGKKLQNMMQLSGGEKALTAIALLFAIQNLKPSPFCVLDEIEAALDDTNVTRFANYLKKLSKSTQFIMITHRRGTMMEADRLYGITMQEKGISTLVSVDLLESELK